MMILGVRVDPVTKDEAIEKIASFLIEAKQHVVTTPNPEIILYAHRREDYRNILNKSDLSLPDGTGLILVSKVMKQPLKERVSGTDMIQGIARIAKDKSLKIALVGGLDQRSVTQAAATMRGWGNSIIYADHGVPKKNWNDRSFHEKMIDELRAASPELIFVAFGHPKQEEWIDANRSNLPSVRLFIGCGGALDFVAGSVKRAPAWMRKAGLEWLWRLLHEPKRFKRIFNAVIVFPLTFLYDYFRKK